MATNPYSPPQAKVADVAVATDEVQPVRLWSASGRIGRLRYLAYSFGGGLVMGFIGAFLAAVVGRELSPIIMLLLYIPFIVFGFLTTIKRSHDMDWSGWTSLLALIPFVAFVWVFKRGTAGENSYGAPPPPNTTGVKVLAFIAPAVAIVGILAAIALPAYQTYVKRAQSIQQSR